MSKTCYWKSVTMYLRWTSPPEKQWSYSSNKQRRFQSVRICTILWKTANFVVCVFFSVRPAGRMRKSRSSEKRWTSRRSRSMASTTWRDSGSSWLFRISCSKYSECIAFIQLVFSIRITIAVCEWLGENILCSSVVCYYRRSQLKQKLAELETSFMTMKYTAWCCKEP